MTRSAADESIFLAALERPTPTEQIQYAEEACAGDPELLRRVQELLDGHFETGGLLDSPPEIAPTADMVTATDRLGTQIGPYKLVEVIGQGGMGTVYRAQQTEPVRRQVAVKVIKLGMDTAQVIARFEAERQALALMDHPNIAHIHDGGTTTTGRPYFAMELVRGIPITEYCDQSQLAVPARLELFIRVCQAVQHAHTKGVIHRDLKPSNVLVTLHDGAPVPKVIDFGVAKALGQRLTDKTLFTAFAQMVGTPMYMSPEQAELSGLDVDTRSDVYSLGVLLYELLSGTTPFDSERMRTVGYDEMRRIIRQEEPVRPSSRISTLGEAASTLSTNRGSEPRRLSRLLRGELDWVVMKCLEKDRTRRYETVDALAKDLARYLADEPVQACPPSAAYRVRKFARRNKHAMVTATILSAAALLAASSFGWAFRDRAARQSEADRDKAARQAEADRDLDIALQETADQRDRGDWVKAQAAFHRAERLVAASGSNARQERVRAAGTDLHMAARLEEIRLGEPVIHLVPLDRNLLDAIYAEEFKAYGIDVTALDPHTSAEIIDASVIRAHLVAALDDWLFSKDCKIVNYSIWGGPPDKRAKMLADARAAYEHLRAVAELTRPDGLSRRILDPNARKDLAALLKLADQPDVTGLSTSSAMLLTRFLWRSGGKNEAVKLLRAVQQRSPDDFLVNYELAVLLSETSSARREEKLGFMRTAVALRPYYATLHLQLGRMLRSAQRLDEAAVAFRTAFKLQPGGKQAYSDLATVLNCLGKQDEALAVYARYVALNPNDKNGQHTLGHAYRRARQWDKAIDAFRAKVELSPTVGYVQTDLVWLLATCPVPEMRNVPEALERAERAKETSADHVSVWRALGVARYRAEDWPGAAEALERANQMRGGESIAGWFFLAMAKWRRDKHEEARLDYDRAIARMRSSVTTEPRSVEQEELERFRDEAEELIVGARKNRLRDEAAERAKRVEDDRRRWDKVIADSSKAIKLRPEDAAAWYRRAGAHVGKGQFKEALSDYSEAFKRQPDDLERGFDYAAALVLTGDAEGYERTCTQWLERVDGLKCIYQAGRKSYLLARVCLLSPDAAADPARLSELAEQAVKARPNAAYYLHTLGLAHYRAGEHTEALQRLQESKKADPNWSGQPLNSIMMAMAHHRQGHTHLARQLSTNAVRAVEEYRPDPKETTLAGAGMHQHDWMAWLVLRREAESLINGTGK